MPVYIQNFSEPPILQDGVLSGVYNENHVTGTLIGVDVDGFNISAGILGDYKAVTVFSTPTSGGFSGFYIVAKSNANVTLFFSDLRINTVVTSSTNILFNEMNGYYRNYTTSLISINPEVGIVSTGNPDYVQDVIDFLDGSIKNPIVYIPINSTLSGPESAASGDTVNVSVSFPDGYIYQEQGVSIYNKDGAIPFSYNDGTLSFTMP